MYDEQEYPTEFEYGAVNPARSMTDDSLSTKAEFAIGAAITAFGLAALLDWIAYRELTWDMIVSGALWLLIVYGLAYALGAIFSSRSFHAFWWATWALMAEKLVASESAEESETVLPPPTTSPQREVAQEPRISRIMRPQEHRMAERVLVIDDSRIRLGDGRLAYLDGVSANEIELIAEARRNGSLPDISLRKLHDIGISRWRSDTGDIARAQSVMEFLVNEGLVEERGNGQANVWTDLGQSTFSASPAPQA